MKFSPIFFGLLLTLGLVLVNEVEGTGRGLFRIKTRRSSDSDDEDGTVLSRSQTTTSTTRMARNLGYDIHDTSSVIHNMSNLNLDSSAPSGSSRRGTNRTGARREDSNRAEQLAGLVNEVRTGRLESGRRNVNSDDEKKAAHLTTNPSRTRRGTNRTGARREGSNRAGSSRQSANNEITEFPSSASGKINLPLHDPTDATFLRVHSYLTANNWGEANLEGFFFVSDVPEVPQINMKTAIKWIQNVIDTYNRDWEAIARGQPTYDYNAYMQKCYEIAGELSKLYQRDHKNEVKLVYRDMVTALTIIYMGLIPTQ